MDTHFETTLFWLPVLEIVLFCLPIIWTVCTFDLPDRHSTLSVVPNSQPGVQLVVFACPTIRIEKAQH